MQRLTLEDMEIRMFPDIKEGETVEEHLKLEESLDDKYLFARTKTKDKERSVELKIIFDDEDF